MKFLVIGSNWLGDAVLTLPALDAVRAAAAEACFEILARGAACEVYEMWSGSVIRPAGSAPADVALVFPRSFRAAWTAWRSGARRRIGYSDECRRWLLTDVIPRTDEARRQHRVAYYHAIARAWSIVPDPQPPRLAVPDWAEQDAQTLLGTWRDRDDLVAVHAGAAYGVSKQWPADRFVDLLRRLERPAVLIGARDEYDLARWIADEVGENARVYAGLTRIPVLAAMLRRCRLFIGNDSGPMHLAAAVGTRVVAIFGSTDPAVTGPWGVPHAIVRRPVECAPCLRRECPLGHHRCMRRVEVSDVLEAARRWL